MLSIQTVFFLNSTNLEAIFLTSSLLSLYFFFKLRIDIKFIVIENNLLFNLGGKGEHTVDYKVKKGRKGELMDYIG